MSAAVDGLRAAQPPPFTWRSNAHLLVANWLNYYVYQQVPYDFIGEGSTLS